MSSTSSWRPRGADAWLALALAPGLGPAGARTLAAAAGGAEALLALPPASLAALGAPAATIAAWAGLPERTRGEAARVAAAGARLVGWDDPSYPTRLRTLPDAPPVLAVRGALDDADVPAVAVVGARRCSAYGRRVAEEIATGLARAGVTVVSGLAAGIDAAAHRAALAAGGRTLAVLGTGIDRVYPSWHASLAADVVRQGALLTELPCGTPALAFNFPRRNRIVSGLGLGVVVVEAAAASGSLITARLAAEQGRLVFAVPGPLGVALHDGPHALLREGATLVRHAADVLEAVAPQCRARAAAATVAAARDALTGDERRVLDALGPAGGHVDDVIRRTALPAPAALETLLALELRGVVAQEPGMRFRQRAA